MSAGMRGNARIARTAAPLLLVLAATVAGSAAQAQCALSGAVATPEPAWVQGGASADTGPWLHAAGVATAGGTGMTLERARGEARNAALAELGQQIQAEVRTRITSELNKVTAEGRTRTSESFRSMSEVLSRVQVRGATVVAEWSDVPGCRLWQRVRVAADEAERARRAATSDAAAAGIGERMASARDATLGAAQRQAALAEAGELARLADPALTSGYSRDAFELQRAELEGQLVAARGREDQYRAAMLRHVQAYARAGQAAAGGERRGAQQQALEALEQAVSLAPAGVPGYTPPFQPPERLATLFAEMNAGCVGRQWFERRSLPLPAALRSAGGGSGSAGAANAAGAACDAERVARERRALALSGRTVALDCSLTLAGVAGGARSAWPKACTALQAALVADGAVPVAAGAKADLTASVHASGQIEERRDADSGRTGWRFRGKVATRLRGSGNLDLADEYEGLTGFNPVSATMAGDLLALAVVQRLDKALTAFWDAK
ncbi:MAG: hypothetical protein JNL85_13375 [Rubrivivax sp.]|nr:hypothetical protein [Rubrivivax sp.]